MVKTSRPLRVMVFGTFDVLHEGHRDFFRQAKRLAETVHLTVSVARDANVLRIKGKLPLHGEKERAAGVRESGLADRIVLGGVREYLPHILRAAPEVIGFGYDQTAYVQGLTAQLAKHGLTVRTVRLKPFKPEQYKSSILKAKMV